MASAKQARAKSSAGAASATKNDTTAKNDAATKHGTQPSPPSQGKQRQQRPLQNRPAQSRGAQGQTRRARDRARARELAVEQETIEPTHQGPPQWLQWTTFVLVIIGFGVSAYMTFEHFTGNATLACSTNSVVDCNAVTKSPQAVVFNIFPVAVLGLVFYAWLLVIMNPWAWRARARRREIGWLRLASMVTGVGFIIYLIYVELFQVGKICLECTSVHVITFVLFVLTMLAAAIWTEPQNTRRIT
jgi:uncharacterized membrane protein